MTFEYNKELIGRVTIYFKEKFGHHINEETAQQYLDSLADLYESFSEFLENDKKE